MKPQEPVSGPKNDRVASVPEQTLQSPQTGTQPHREAISDWDRRQESQW